MLRKCFGIISWFPTTEPVRIERQERINRLLSQLNKLWPTIDILIIAQNWQDFKPIEISNNIIIKEYPELGILGARRALREAFLALDYDYIIMFDDDAIVEYKDNTYITFMEEIDKHPKGFCFIHGNNSRYHPYCAAQLNLCAISRYIYEKEPMVDIDPQKNEGFEDSIYACLLHHKWGKYEFNPPLGIRCVQFSNPKLHATSTWVGSCEGKRPFRTMVENTDRIQKYIAENKAFPASYKQMIKEYKPPIDNPADGRKGSYLYF